MACCVSVIAYSFNGCVKIPYPRRNEARSFADTGSSCAGSGDLIMGHGAVPSVRFDGGDSGSATEDGTGGGTKRARTTDDLLDLEGAKRLAATGGAGAGSGTAGSSLSSLVFGAAGGAGTRSFAPQTGGSGSSTVSSWNQKATHGHAGLANQGATCYMNSLLQALFMTPELRRGLYAWEFKEEDQGKPEDCIPYQLQRLFGLLQLTTKRSLSTKPLTTSFGWTSADSFQQHDVQELCRVLFNAIEVSFKGTPHAGLVDNMYKGKLRDYVRCCECNHENAREDDFMDVSLVIKPFGATKCVSSVQEALKQFILPEVLSGGNQYHCSKCDKKVDAHKGLKFGKLPYLLALQLKRFDFDYQTAQRVKLNDRVSFPLWLNMNDYVGDSPAALRVPEVEEDAAAGDEEDASEAPSKPDGAAEHAQGSDRVGPESDEEKEADRIAAKAETAAAPAEEAASAEDAAPAAPRTLTVGIGVVEELKKLLRDNQVRGDDPGARSLRMCYEYAKSKGPDAELSATSVFYEWGIENMEHPLLDVMPSEEDIRIVGAETGSATEAGDTGGTVSEHTEEQQVLVRHSVLNEVRQALIDNAAEGRDLEARALRVCYEFCKHGEPADATEAFYSWYMNNARHPQLDIAPSATEIRVVSDDEYEAEMSKREAAEAANTTTTETTAAPVPVPRNTAEDDPLGALAAQQLSSLAASGNTTATDVGGSGTGGGGGGGSSAASETKTETKEGDTKAETGKKAESGVNGEGGDDEVKENPDEPSGERTLAGAQLLRRWGPLVYELYAVLVHSGGAHGGHYYAYIKSLNDGEWFKFNDSTVTAATVKEVKTTFGGEKKSTSSYGGYTYTTTYSANAYMLMYRLFEPDRNAQLPTADEVPPHVQTAVEAERLVEELEEKEKQREREMRRPVIWYNDKSKVIPMHKDTTVAELTRAAFDAFGFAEPSSGDAPTPASTDGAASDAAASAAAPAAEPAAEPAPPASGAGQATTPAPTKVVPFHCVRLRAYNKNLDWPMQPYALEDGGGDLKLDDAQIRNSTCLLLETRESDGDFPVYDPDSFKLRVIALRDGAFLPEVILHPKKKSTLGELRATLATHPDLGAIPVDRQRILVMKSWSGTVEVRELVGDERTLHLGCNLYPNTVIHVEEVPQETTTTDAPAEAGLGSITEGGGQGTGTDSDSSDGKGAEMTTVQPSTLGSRIWGSSGATAGTSTTGTTVGKKKLTAKDSAAVKLFEEVACSVTIKYNLLGEKEYSESITIDRRKTVQQLKEEMAKVLGVGADEFTLRRYRAEGMMIKNTAMTVMGLSLPKDPVLHCSAGGVKQGQHLCKFYLFSPAYVTGSGPVVLPPMYPLTGKRAAEKLAMAEALIAEESTNDADEVVAAGGGALFDGDETEEKVQDGEVGSDKKDGDADVAAGDVETTASAAAGATPTPDVSDTKDTDVKVVEGDTDDAGEVADAPAGEEDTEAGERTGWPEWEGEAGDPAKLSTSELMFELPVGDETEVTDLRQLVLTELVKKGKVAEGTDVRRIRLRCKFSGSRPTDCLLDGLTVRDARPVYEYSQFAIDVLDEPEQLEPDTMIIYVQFFDHASWSLGKRREVIIPRKGFRMCDIADIVAKQANVPRILLKVLDHSYYTQDIMSFPKKRWFRGDDERVVDSAPWYLREYNVVVVCDSSVPLKELTPDEVTARQPEAYKPSSYLSSSYGSSVGSSTTTSRRREGGIKIKTKEDREREREEAEKASEAAGEEDGGSEAKASGDASQEDTSASGGAGAAARDAPYDGPPASAYASAVGDSAVVSGVHLSTEEAKHGRFAKYKAAQLKANQNVQESREREYMGFNVEGAEDADEYVDGEAAGLFEDLGFE